jgi:hypothetical protein
MPAPLPNLRYERKFLAPGFSLADVLALIRRHPAAFREAYPARFVNNLYLDSPARRDYFDHVDGLANRVKTRIRWYGPLSGHIETPTLERKIKRGNVSGKVGHRLPPLYVNGGIARRDVDAALEGAGMPAILLSALRNMEPALVNSYLRHYFQSADGCFRITADFDLQFFSLRQGTGQMTLAPPPAIGVIVELKFDPEDAEHAVRVTDALPLCLLRCSKYVLGIEQLRAIQPAV